MVSQADLQKARQALQDEEVKKRQRSNMSHYLKNTEKLEAYKSLPMQERKSFLESWVADQMGKSEGKKSFDSSRTLATQKARARGWEWVSKAAMITKFGEVKATTLSDASL